MFAIVLLAILEGLTEFIPVSSTGHLVVAANWLGFQPAWREPFLVFIQLGAVMAVVFDRMRDLIAVVTAGRRSFADFVLKISLGFLPSAVLGLLLHDVISRLLQSTTVVSMAWVLGGVLILWLDRPRAHSSEATPRAVGLQAVSAKQALAVGLAQCLALWPGMSRSGSTIIGGLAAGLDRPSATLFSFYLAIPTMCGASALELFKFRSSLGGAGPSFAVGAIVSFFVALATVRWLLAFVATHTFRPFAYYRIVAGLLLLFVLPEPDAKA